MTASMARSFKREASRRNLRPTRISDPSRSLPQLLVRVQPGVAQVVLTQRRVQHVRGELAADQPVVDAAAGGRLDETSRVTDREETLTVGLRHWTERKNLQSWRGKNRPLRVVALADGRRKLANRAAALSSQSKPMRLKRRAPRVKGTVHANPPGATLRPR